MAKKFYTIGEIQTMKLYEMPNMVYNAIIDALRARFGILTPRLIEIFNRAVVMQLDQYIDLYRIISII